MGDCFSVVALGIASIFVQSTTAFGPTSLPQIYCDLDNLLTVPSSLYSFSQCQQTAAALTDLVKATGDSAVICSSIKSGSGGYFLGVQGDRVCDKTMAALNTAAGLSGNDCCLNCLGDDHGVFSTVTIDQQKDAAYCRSAVAKINAALLPVNSINITRS